MPGSTHAYLKKMPLARVLASLITCALLFTAVAYALIKQEAQRDLTALISSEATKIELSAMRMEHAFISVSNTLRTNAKVFEVTAFGSSQSAQNKQALAQFLSSVLTDDTLFQQARFIGLNGHELVRAERTKKGIVVTPDNALQYKGDRYYVKQSLELPQHEIFVSALDLDLEHGAVVVPFRPVMRFAIGVFDTQGQRQGVFVMNMQGQPLLNILADTKNHSHSVFLLNSTGHVLSGPDNTKQWGFMFGLPAEFKTQYPLAWDKINQERRGHIVTENGLFVFETVNPLTYIQLRPWEPEQNRELAPDAYWKVISFTPPNQLPSVVAFFKPSTVAAYLAGLVVLLSSVLGLLVLSHKRHLLRQQIAGQARRFRRIANALGEGLIVINRFGIITYVNPEAEDILGWDNDELLSRKCQDILNTDPSQKGDCPLLQVLDSGEVLRSQNWIFRRKNDHSIPVDLIAAPLSDDAGEEGVVISFRDYSTIKQYQEEIYQLAYHDTLTGLPNRRILEDRLTQSLLFAQRYNQTIALLFLDLDHFKQVNDVYGHATGDALLKKVATRLSNCVRDSDTVVRMGGDEFIILLPELRHPDDAQLFARKILTALNYPLIIEGQEMRVSASIGVAITTGGATTAKQLLQKADNAMYKAKHAGRNTYVLTSDDPIPAELDAP